MYSLRRGIGYVITERDIFSRYHVGETMTETAMALREIGLGDGLETQPFPIKQGVTLRERWQECVLGSDHASKQRKSAGPESNLERHAEHLR